MIPNLLILSISGTLLALSLVIFIRSRKYKTKIKYLMASVITISIGNTAVGLNINNLIFMIIVTSLLPLGIIILFFHYEKISHPRPRLGVSLILLGLFTFLISSKIILPIYMWLNDISFNIYYGDLRLYDDNFIYTLFRIRNVSQSAIIFSVFILAFFTVLKELKLTNMRPILIELIGLILLILYGGLYLVRDLFLYDYYDLLTLIALIFSLSGLLLIISNYILHPDYLYLLPFPIYNFMVFNEGGSPCYVRNVEKLDIDKPQANRDHLMAGALTAVSNMFREVLGAGANIRYIDADEFKMIVTSLPEKKGAFIVISRGETALFKSSIKRFIDTWTPQLLKDINEVMDLNKLQPRIDKLIKASFPYVVFS